MKTHGTAVWQGGIKDGKGAISTKSGALKDYPYGFSSRFEGKPGTNPEELIGAAHAGCFTTLCRSFSARPSSPPITWKPWPKSRSKNWPTALPSRPSISP
jgi:organic hydroperoxide reductase OsmC/OhrA